MVLVSDRGAEKRHDAVAGVLVDRPLEAVNAVGEDLEEAVENPVPFFRVELLGEIHRALHVGEEDRHLLALAFEGTARGQDLLGEVTGSIASGLRRRRSRPGFRCRLSAPIAELYARWELSSALPTDEG
jgi:hypothetical protein